MNVVGAPAGLKGVMGAADAWLKAAIRSRKELGFAATGGAFFSAAAGGAGL
jgi:hypothetical protein